MTTSIVEPERIAHRSVGDPPPGRYVLYWMQASVRTRQNPALEHAVRQANRLGVPLLVCFGITDRYPETSLRHQRFLLEGVADAARGLTRRHIDFVVRIGDPADIAVELAGDARMVVVDRGYLRLPRRWRRSLVSGFGGPIDEVEGDVVVPVATASVKREWAARTLRPRIHARLERFLTELRPTSVDHRLDDVPPGVSVDAVDDLLGGLRLDRSVPVASFRGGQTVAEQTLREFLERRLATYAEHRNQPQTDDVSYLSMYLHFGHISPVTAVMAARQSGVPQAQIDSFVEELVVRRELNFNYVAFEPDYDTHEALPDWARATLDAHRDDRRDPRYGTEELEQGRTHDPYWNAAMAEMRHTGYLNNYMRMYWGKKIIEWSPSPEEAHAVALGLNNRYLLDGRDPNSYGNVGWLFGLHDRPWGERPIFGTVRYMAASGLERKTDPTAYVRKVERLTGSTLF
jgi:deoxyribodipyrimidine photo-lyase